MEKVCELKDRLQCEHWYRGTLRGARNRWKHPARRYRQPHALRWKVQFGFGQHGGRKRRSLASIPGTRANCVPSTIFGTQPIRFANGSLPDYPLISAERRLFDRAMGAPRSSVRNSLPPKSGNTPGGGRKSDQIAKAASPGPPDFGVFPGIFQANRGFAHRDESATDRLSPPGTRSRRQFGKLLLRFERRP